MTDADFAQLPNRGIGLRVEIVQLDTGEIVHVHQDDRGRGIYTVRRDSDQVEHLCRATEMRTALRDARET